MELSEEEAERARLHRRLRLVGLVRFGGVGWSWVELGGVGWGWMGLDGVGWGWMDLVGLDRVGGVGGVGGSVVGQWWVRGQEWFSGGSVVYLGCVHVASHITDLHCHGTGIGLIETHDLRHEIA